MRALLLAFAAISILSAVNAVGTVQVISYLRNETTSANAYIVYDDQQILLIDVGKEEDVTYEVITQIQTLEAGNRTFNAIFLTHGHPDHVMALWKVKEEFPSVPALVATPEIHQELVNLMFIFGKYLNMSSPGNPQSTLPDDSKFNYSVGIHPLRTEAQLWKGSGMAVHTDRFLYSDAETHHYSFIHFASEGFLFSGDLLYARAHLFMGYDVTLETQCDWIAALITVNNTWASDTLVYPGHGAAGLPLPVVAEEDVAYIEFARTTYLKTCNSTAAANAIMAKYPTWVSSYLLLDFSASIRCPNDATLLGCDCTSFSSSCTVNAPPCRV